MKTFTIIGGVNGTGKSSLTGVLKKTDKSLGRIIDVDKINIEHNNDIIAGGRAAINIIDECINKGICFTQETTLSGHKTLKTIKAAIDNGYFIRLFYVGLNSLDESLKRIENRVAKGGHDIPAERVEKRFNSRYDDVVLILPYCNEAVFYDNENGFRVVAEYLNGELIVLGDDAPKWLTELKENL